ncbi:MAG: HD domain-containing protein [Candidatus Lernaella stagnicola]|nr:HD domain-containing protein [Candidatus Lernaella stagnicola]
MRKQRWGTLLSELTDHVYLVGGTVRDLALGIEPKDIDLLLPAGHALDVGERLAKKLGARFVLLHADFGVCRVVLRPEYWLDLADFQGATLEEDLARRDLRINAVALRFPGPAEPVDPLHGLDDLSAGIARVPSPEVLAADPVRVLRVFRFAAQFDLTVDEQTIAACRDHAKNLAETPGERVWEELRRILGHARAAPWIAALDECRIVDALFPPLAAAAGFPQPEYHHLDVRDHSIEAAKQVDALVRDEFFAPALAEPENRAMLRLAALLHDVGKPPSATPDEKRGFTRFPMHSRLGAQLSAQMADRLRLSKKEKKRLVRLVDVHMRPHQLAELHANNRLTSRAARRFFVDLKEDWLLALALARADLLATNGPKAPPEGLARAKAFAAFLASERERRGAPGEPLVSGEEILTLGVPPGPAVGRLLEAVEEERFRRPSLTRREALDLLARIAHNENLIQPKDSN